MANRFTISTKFSVLDMISGPITAITRKVDELGASSDKAKKRLSDDFKAAGAAIASIAGVADAVSSAVFGLAIKAQEAADSVADQAQALGMSNQALQEYRYLAQLSGMETTDMDKALEKLTINLGKAGGATEETLGALGLSVDQLRSAGPDQVLELIAGGMQNIEDPTQKAAIAVELFGRSSVRMVNALSRGSDGIREMRDEARASGYVMDEAAISAGNNFGDAMDRLKMTFSGVVNTLGAQVIPKIEQFVVTITEGLRPGGQFRALMDELSAAFDFMAKVAGVVINVLIGLFKVIEPLAPVIVGIVAAIAAYNTIMAIYEAVTTAAAVAQMVLNGAMTVNPIGLIVVAIAALIGIVILLVKHWDEVVVGLSKLWEVIKGVGQAFLKYLLMPVNLVMDAIGGLLMLISKIPGVGDKMQPAIDSLNNFQAKMNETLTGTAGAFDFAGVAQNTAANVAAVGTPVSSQTTTNNNSTVDVNFNNPPAGTTIRQSAPAPGVRLNMGAVGLR